MTENKKLKIWVISVPSIISILGIFLSFSLNANRDNNKIINQELEKKLDKQEYYIDKSECDKKFEKQDQASEYQTKLLIQVLQQQEKANANIEWLMKKQR